MRYVLIISLFCSLCISCVDNTLIDTHSKVIGGSWDFSDPFDHNFNLDEYPSTNVSAVVRYSEEFPYENLYLRSTITSQSDTIYHDIESFMLQNELGQWKGKKKGELYKIKLPITQNINSTSGQLGIRIEQFSRDQLLNGIQSIELIVEKAHD